MLKIGLICNTSAAFPLLQWLHSQAVLAGLLVLDRKTDFYSDATSIAKQSNISISYLQKSNISDQLISWQSINQLDLVLVLGFPYKIGKEVFEKSKFGFYNIHFGKLPNYGGSFPVFWQIFNQEKEAVLTIHKMNETFDNGPIAIEIPFEIKPEQTYGIVEMNFGMVAINAVYYLIDNLLNNKLLLKNQPDKLVKYLPKPTINDLVINWEKHDAAQIVALVVAANPWNKGAIVHINNLDLKIIEAEIGEHFESKDFGKIVSISQAGIVVICAKNTSLLIKIVYSQLGYFSAGKLATIGIKVDDYFTKLI
jgi:methionyl-tRNA formyltransferase